VNELPEETQDLAEEQDREPEPAELASVEEQLEAAQKEAAKNLDSLLRAQAELANARKRFEKQQAQMYANANAELVLKLLPALDDFDRAMESAPDSVREDKWFEGVELVHRKLMGILESLNVQKIEAVGQPFDPNFHDALAQEPSEEYESGVVTREMIKGYQLGDRVVRPSLVYVAE
jgi:molecular chaperone GrpE